ncbi:unnamed protein product [Amoebophrya sp. A25]|nr:unnamed protein product [Amoebophrya sp. A25]|eukprot:GSA25T00001928001.1
MMKNLLLACDIYRYSEDRKYTNIRMEKQGNGQPT